MVGTRPDEATGINLEHLCRSIPAAELDGRAQYCCVTGVWLVVFTTDLYFDLPRAQYCMVVFSKDLFSPTEGTVLYGGLYYRPLF